MPRSYMFMGMNMHELDIHSLVDMFTKLEYKRGLKLVLLYFFSIARKQIWFSRNSGIKNNITIIILDHVYKYQHNFHFGKCTASASFTYVGSLYVNKTYSDSAAHEKSQTLDKWRNHCDAGIVYNKLLHAGLKHLYNRIHDVPERSVPIKLFFLIW